jgi:hypothetical protein
MGRARKEGKPKSNRANVVKNLKRIEANNEALKRMKHDLLNK